MCRVLVYVVSPGLGKYTSRRNTLSKWWETQGCGLVLLLRVNLIDCVYKSIQNLVCLLNFDHGDVVIVFGLDWSFRLWLLLFLATKPVILSSARAGPPRTGLGFVKTVCHGASENLRSRRSTLA